MIAKKRKVTNPNSPKRASELHFEKVSNSLKTEDFIALDDTDEEEHRDLQTEPQNSPPQNGFHRYKMGKSGLQQTSPNQKSLSVSTKQTDKDAKAEKTSKSIESASKISAGSVKSSGKKSRHFPSTSTPQQVKFPIAQDNLKGENNLDEQKSASSLKSSCKTSSPGPKGLSTQLPGRKSSKRRKSNSETVFENIRSPEEKKVASSAIQSQEKSGQEVQNEENIQEKEVLQSPKKKDQNERKPESSTIQIDSSIQQTESSLDRDSKQKPKKPGRKNRNVVFSESTVSDTEMPQSGGNDLAQEDESDVVSLEKENLADKDIISGGDQTNPKRRVLKHPKRNQESPKQKLGAPNEFHSEKIDEQLSKDIAEKASNKKVKRDKETDSREENLEKKSKASAPGWILNNDPKAGSTKQKVSSGEKKTQKAPGSDGSQQNVSESLDTPVQPIHREHRQKSGNQEERLSSLLSDFQNSVDAIKNLPKPRNWSAQNKSKSEEKKQIAAKDSSPIQLSPGTTPEKPNLKTVFSQHDFPIKEKEQELVHEDSDKEESKDMRKSIWHPPASGLSLIEEMLYGDPWKLLTACMLLNKTSGRAVRKVMWDLFAFCPTPEAGRDADQKEIETIITPLGLYKKRAAIFKRFCKEYIEKEWTEPQQLHGIGQYAADAYYIFCRGKWKERGPPTDKDLLGYYKFLKETNGQGKGFDREIFTSDPSSPCCKSI